MIQHVENSGGEEYLIQGYSLATVEGLGSEALVQICPPPPADVREIISTENRLPGVRHVGAELEPGSFNITPLFREDATGALADYQRYQEWLAEVVATGKNPLPPRRHTEVPPSIHLTSRRFQM